MAKISDGCGLRSDGRGSGDDRGSEDERGAEPEPLANIGERRPPSNGFEQAYLDCATGRLLRGLMLGRDGFRRRSFRGVDMLDYLWAMASEDGESRM